jgi:hypothetical protein
MVKYKHDTGNLPFFRYSKICFLQWVGGIALMVIGSNPGAYDMTASEGSIIFLLGLLMFLFGFVVNEILINIAAYTCQSLEDPALVRKKYEKIAQKVTPIVYSKGYNITACGFEKCHPFDSTKYMRTWDFLVDSSVINVEKLECYHDVTLPTRKWLLEVMSPIYLMKFNLSLCVNKFVELPLCFLPGWFLRS